MENNKLGAESVENVEPQDDNKDRIIYARLEVLERLLALLDKLRGDSIDDITYIRARAGLDFLVYELKNLIKFDLDRGLDINDLSAKDIADMTVVRKTDTRDIIVKDGIDKEMEYICEFIDRVIETGNKKLDLDEMAEFIHDQAKINEEIENHYRKS